LRHKTLQKSKLTNDSVTLATEIPIWLTETDIAALEQQYGAELAPRVGAAERSITGRIEFLAPCTSSHVLDYKPDARTGKLIAQLAIHAPALTRLVPGVKLFNINCAWSNKEAYCEIFPRTLFDVTQVGIAPSKS
jgi:hypothetical protein